MTRQAPAQLNADQAFRAIGATIGPRRATLPRRLRIAFVLTDGRSYLLDTRAPRLIEHGHFTEADLLVLTNPGTLSALAQGTFNPTEAEPGQLFLWSGDPAAWTLLGKCFEGTRSLFSAHLAALNKDAKQ